MAEAEIRQFISHLAVHAKISASTQTVALSALLFLYRDVLKQELPYVKNIERAKPAKHLPVVFTRNEDGEWVASCLSVLRAKKPIGRGSWGGARNALTPGYFRSRLQREEPDHVPRNSCMNDE